MTQKEKPKEKENIIGDIMAWEDVLKRTVDIQQFKIILEFYTKSGRPYPPMNIEEEIMDTKEGAIKMAEKLMDEAEEGLYGPKEIEYGGYVWSITYDDEDGDEMIITEDGEEMA
tara:strand:- start:24 stop:365 length:342 start_codon:yes stop_codon:yes gene_type:complete